ncbi:hypothetical protein ACS0TY_000389 [Phlomoides rotata]
METEDVVLQSRVVQICDSPPDYDSQGCDFGETSHMSTTVIIFGVFCRTLSWTVFEFGPSRLHFLN